MKSDHGNCFSCRSEISSIHSEDTVSGLKVELERCLGMYSKKRALVEKLQLELSETKSALEQANLRLKHAELSHRVSLSSPLTVILTSV